MTYEIMYPSPNCLATFNDGQETDFFSVSAKGRERSLVTTQYYERNQGMDGVNVLKSVDWKIRVRDNAELFLASSGICRDELNGLWGGWISGDTLSVFSLMHEKPFQMKMSESDTLLFPAVAIMNGRMHLYFYRSTSTGTLLMRHEFSGVFMQPITVTTRVMDTLPAIPAATVVAPLSGSKKGETVVAWCAAADKGTQVGALLTSPEGTVKIAPDTVLLMKPLKNQRMSVHVDKKLTFSVSFFTETETNVYHCGELQFYLLDNELKRIVTAAPLLIVPGKCNGAAALYLRSSYDKKLFLVVLTDENRLAILNSQFDYLEKMIENGVPSDDITPFSQMRIIGEKIRNGYNFPLLVSSTGFYEAWCDEDGNIVVGHID